MARKRNQIHCDLPDGEFEEFARLAERIGMTNGALCRAVLRHFLNAPDEEKKRILTYEIETAFEKKSSQ